MRSVLLALQLYLLAGCTFAATPTQAAAIDNLDQQLDALPIIDEIDTATQAPVHEYPAGASRVSNVLGQPARSLPIGDKPVVVGWVIGKDKGLQPGRAYLLEVEYPDDVPRAIFLANRGADHVRGWATGSACGDARQQYTQPSLESLAYPQTGKWQRYRSVFFLHHRFQGLYAQRDSKAGGRPFAPADGFHVLVFQTKKLNDPRSQGAAVGKIRLREIPNVAALYAPATELPESLPKRRIFFREEMADEAISAAQEVDRGVVDPVDWYLDKVRLSKMLAINTFTKDLLEFGFNQGWESGDQNWVMNRQPPGVRLWDDLAPRVAAEGLDLLPYYEYKGAIGMQNAQPKSLAWQRRAEKLYHGQPNTQYTQVWWTEDHNADLTDPDTLIDAKKLLDKTIVAHQAAVKKNSGRFAGAWFRVRDNHLPISFAAATIKRFQTALPEDKLAQTASRETLVASYEGDRKLYDRYIAWWHEQRSEFLHALRDHAAKSCGDDQFQVLFTPWISEQIPMLRDASSGAQGTPVQVTTDDPKWWDDFAKTQEGNWFRWALAPTSFDRVVKERYYRSSLQFREQIGGAPDRHETFHSAPPADPGTYHDQAGVMLTYPMGRLFTVADTELLDEYRTPSGLTMIRHYTLNEDDHDRKKGKSDLPFDGQVGYVSVDVDRAGPHVRLLEARAVAAGDPTNIGYLCGSSFSTGFPDYVRRFNQAFVAAPALPSRLVAGAASDKEVAVREIATPKHGTYYYVVNTSMIDVKDVVVQLPAKGPIRDLVERRDLGIQTKLTLDLHSGELRTYRVLSQPK